MKFMIVFYASFACLNICQCLNTSTESTTTSTTSSTTSSTISSTSSTTSSTTSESDYDENISSTLLDTTSDDAKYNESYSENEVSFKEPQDPAEFMDYFEELMRRTRLHLEEVFSQYMPKLIELSSSVILSPDCTFDVIRILFGLQRLKPWAIKLIDASGKIPDGILDGTLTALGSYDECLEARIGDEENEGSTLTAGQYCAINIKPFLPPKPALQSLEKAFNDAADAKGYPKEYHLARIAPLFYYLKLRLGLCVPASCTMNDLYLLTNRLSYRFGLNVTVQSCDVQQPFHITMDQIAPLCIIIILLLIIMIATACEVFRRSRCKKNKMGSNASILTRCWLSFSAYSNCAKIFSTKRSENSISSLYGLRVLSLLWIIVAHSYLTMDFRATGRLLQIRKIPKGFFFQIILNASLAIETFFFISGILVTYTTLKKMKSSKWGKVNWMAFYLHRFMRLTPAIMLLLVVLFSIYRIGDGPLWKEIINPTVAKCQANWWKHLLYINNFYEGKTMCFLHLWHIAADMQLFIFTPFLLMILHRKPYMGRIVLLLLVSAVIVSTGVVTYLQRLPPTLLFNNPDPSSRKAYGNLILLKPYPHAAPYLIGMLTGYLLFINSKIKFSTTVKCLGWILSIVIALFEVFSTWQWNNGSVPGQLIASIYASLFRVFWAASLAWVVIACHYGFGGIVNSILSFHTFVPLSRISYVAYLIHPGLMYVFIASTRNIFAFSHYFVIQLFFSHLVTTFIASFILTLIIDIPFCSLERIFYEYLIMGKYGLNIKLYSVTQCNDPPSDNSSSDTDIHKKWKPIATIEKYNKLNHVSISDIQYIFNKKPTDQSNLVFNYKL